MSIKFILDLEHAFEIVGVHDRIHQLQNCLILLIKLQYILLGILQLFLDEGDRLVKIILDIEYLFD